jgi:hypothetical protein
MTLFTVVVDHAGGTYIDQVTAPSVVRALRAWAVRAPSRGIPGIGPAFTARALNDVLFRDPTPIEGVRNVWCTSLLIRGTYALINIIATSRASVPTGRSSFERFLNRANRKRPRNGTSRS